MPAPADEPLAKSNINLYAADKAWLYRRYGHGWTEIVRKLVRDHIRAEDKPKEVIEWPISK
jgi:hypothetical protein